jgi:hypothetical protein
MTIKVIVFLTRDYDSKKIRGAASVLSSLITKAYYNYFFLAIVNHKISHFLGKRGIIK